MMTARLHIRLGALAALALASAALPARELGAQAAMRAAGPDTIRGIVFDSLLHQPIPEASVQADEGAVSTLTDREGRFTLISPSPIHKVTVFHDFLDRTGLGSLQAPVTEKTSRSMMILSTPSLATIWSRLCAGQDMEKTRSGIVFGTVKAADARTRLAGALVRVSWGFVSASAVGRNTRTTDAKSDATGSYYACGAPPSANVYVMGYSSSFKSGAITVQGDTLPLRRVDLVLGEYGKSATIRGTVKGPNSAPMVGAIVDVDGSDATAKTDVNGRFSLPNVPTGSRTIEVRAIGYAPIFEPVAVLEKQNDDVDVEMRSVALPGVNITGRNVTRLQLDYEQRRREGFGTFKDSTEIVRHTSIRSIFQGIPSLVITGPDATAFGLFTPTMSINNNPAGGCPANIFIDGQLADPSVLISLSKEQIAAIEVYVRQEVAPAKYLLLQNDCGVVLVWTKLQFNKH